MKIYILNRSPHNEDFLLDGYALDEQGIKQLALNYCKDIYYLDNIEPIIRIDMENKSVCVDINDINVSFRIHELEQVKKN